MLHRLKNLSLSYHYKLTWLYVYFNRIFYIDLMIPSLIHDLIPVLVVGLFFANDVLN